MPGRPPWQQYYQPEILGIPSYLRNIRGIGEYWPGVNPQRQCPHCESPLHDHYHRCMFWCYPPEMARGKYIEWMAELLRQEKDVKSAHSREVGNPKNMPPTIVRMMGRTMDEVQRVMNSWCREEGRPLPDFLGAWYVETAGRSNFPTEDRVRQIRSSLGLPEISGPEGKGGHDAARAAPAPVPTPPAPPRRGREGAEVAGGVKGGKRGEHSPAAGGKNKGRGGKGGQVPEGLMNIGPEERASVLGLQLPPPGTVSNRGKAAAVPEPTHRTGGGAALSEPTAQAKQVGL